MQKVSGVFVPLSDVDRDVVSRMRSGDVIRCNFTQPRNVKFHRKFFALLEVGFDAWEPPETEYRGLPTQKDPERFRKDCITAAGFYDVVSSLDGSVRLEAKSMSFASMDEEEFNRLYNAIANVILMKVLTNYTRDDLDRVVEQILMF